MRSTDVPNVPPTSGKRPRGLSCPRSGAPFDIDTAGLASHLMSVHGLANRAAFDMVRAQSEAAS
jgi:hypothetical protein